MRARFAVACAVAAVAAFACGESRRPIGEECLRDEDCLSNYCAARSCVSAPSLVTGSTEPPNDEEPLIPVGDSAAPVADAAVEGG
jgi:hypothetical protein